MIKKNVKLKNKKCDDNLASLETIKKICSYFVSTVIFCALKSGKPCWDVTPKHGWGPPGKE